VEDGESPTRTRCALPPGAGACRSVDLCPGATETSHVARHPLVGRPRGFQVNKLVWPAPGGIGVHVWEELEESERIANEYNFINGTGLLEQHTTDEYAVLANKELKLEGLDVEGQYFTQAAFQRTMRFCLTDAGEVEICFGTDEGPSGEGPKTAVIIPATVVSGLAAVGLFAGLWYRSVSGRQKQRQARRHPPGLVDPKQLVSIVVTDIEDSTRLWAMFPAAMVRAQELHDKCLRHCLKACQGYEVCTEGDSFTVAFHDPDEAVEWCCMVQEALQGLSWPPPIGSGAGGSFDLPPWHGKKRPRRKGRPPRDRSTRRGSVLPAEAIVDMEKNVSGDDATRLLMESSRPEPSASSSEAFNGIRVRMGIFTGRPGEVVRHEVTRRVSYGREFLRRAASISDTGHGGQIVLTTATLAELDGDGLADFGIALHLGCHILNQGEGDEPVDLFMLLLHALANRLGKFPPLRTSKQVGPGYFQAPGKESLTICFKSVLNLSAIQSALPEDSKQMLKLLCSCVRHELRQWGGYECEEHSGDFLIAFDESKSAVMWALSVQEALVSVDWPEAITDSPSCETLMLGNSVMFHGPRLKIGMATGSVMKKVPNAVTGRADYFGPLLNLAARIKSEAAGGQVLVDSGTWKAVQGTGAPILGISIDTVLLKGIQDPIQVFQVALQGSPISMRSFPVRARGKERDKEIKAKFSNLTSLQGNYQAVGRSISSTLPSFRKLVFKPRSAAEHDPVELTDLSHSDLERDWHDAGRS